MLLLRSVVCLALALSTTVDGLATPYSARSAHHRAALAARAPGPAPLALDKTLPPTLKTTKKRRRVSRRCINRSPLSAEVQHVPSTQVDVPVNVAPAMQTTPVQESPAPSPTPDQAPPPQEQTTQQPAPQEQPTQQPPQEQPSPTPSPALEPTSEPSPAPADNNNNNNNNNNNGGGGGAGSGGAHVGEGTFYDPGLGACGFTNNGEELIAAVSQLLFDTFPGATANPNNNPICGRRATVRFEGKVINVGIVDRCVGCAFNDIDLSPRAFREIADPNRGRLNGVTWTID